MCRDQEVMMAATSSHGSSTTEAVAASLPLGPHIPLGQALMPESCPVLPAGDQASALADAGRLMAQMPQDSSEAMDTTTTDLGVSGFRHSFIGTQSTAAVPEQSALERMQQTLNEAALEKAVSKKKLKNCRCKQCKHVSKTKEESWHHNRIHSKADLPMRCPQCEFVTEYKHHLQYHLRNHLGSKPFKCNKCSYSCVNKSMLDSHMKSHTSYFQYRCSNCTYATKYCHSLKLHLRKYGHRPATIIGPDGSVIEPRSCMGLVGTRGQLLDQSSHLFGLPGPFSAEGSKGDMMGSSMAEHKDAAESLASHYEAVMSLKEVQSSIPSGDFDWPLK